MRGWITGTAVGALTAAMLVALPTAADIPAIAASEAATAEPAVWPASSTASPASIDGKRCTKRGATRVVGADTAAVIVEPVQGVGGAFDMGADFLAALRARCDAVGAVLIFDEVQIGVGRSGHPFGADLYGVRPDMITTAKALGNGFPCGALLMTPAVTAALKLEGLGTTFGGGPMACAAIEAVIDAIEAEDLLANVRRVSQYIRSTCTVGPVVGHQGAGFLHGLICDRPAKAVQTALLSRDILAGTSGDPRVVRLLPPYTLREAEVDLLRAALESL